MSSSLNRFHAGGRRAAVRIGLTCMSMLACALTAAEPAPIDRDTDPVVVTDTPPRPPHKHRQVVPGLAKPRTYISKPQQLITTLPQTRSTP